ncbi:DUF2070 family protein [Methanosphaera sp. WGK6]|uniref:DUF2070 family protein n=1 Tax=Methanosphaera sp. WGK6 TaxID=1561964 RepID=UPI00084C3385|nr:DUF2070 family protein [Methanosphaera sp. WGK6]OED29847.1 hypothetical protein NL43_06045 [Methanosphaera sp. WGK6]
MALTDRIMNTSKYLIKLPETKSSLLLIIIVSFITGGISSCLEPGLSLNSLAYYFLSGGATTFFLLGTTAIASGGLVYTLVNKLNKRHIKQKQAMFLSFIGMLIVCILYIIGYIISVVTNITLLNFLVLGILFTFAIESMILWATSNIRYYQGILIGAIQPILILSMLVLINYITFATISINAVLSLYLKAILGAIVLAIAVYAFVEIIQSPIKNNLGVGGLELLSLFVAQISDGSQGMEQIFNEIGEEIDTSVSLISFKTEKGIKANYISPGVHPGPVGSIGGSNLPTIVANQLENFSIIAHGAATHDFNPVTEKEVDKITEAINSILPNLKYSDKASKFQRIKSQDAKLGVQQFNDGLVLLTTFAPNPGDDIDYGIGLALSYQAKAQTGVKDIVFVDCHNCLEGNYDRLLAGQNRVTQLENAIEQINPNQELYPIKMGYAYNPLDEIPVKDGIGESGVKLMLTEVDTQKMLYVVFDGNNMQKGFREQIITTIKEKYPEIDMIEVMTTDTHLVNTISGGGLTVGSKHQEILLKEILKLIPKAINDLEYVQVASGTAKIQLKAFGPNNSTQLVTTLSSILSVAKLLAPLVFLVAALITIFGIFRI